MPRCNRCYHRVANPGWICIMYDCDIFGDKGWKKMKCDCYLEDLEQSKRLDRDMINQMLIHYDPNSKFNPMPKTIYTEVMQFKNKYNEDYLQEKSLCIQLMKHHFFRFKVMKEW